MTAANWQGKHWIRDDKRTAIYLRDGFACVYCGKDLRDGGPRSLTLDHLRPRSQGGDNQAHNLVTACDSCNSARADRTYFEFAPDAVARVLALISKPLNLDLARALLAGRAGDPTLEATR